jgi:crotonobetainyl-CoA:carnitine CoA-transferase CaiB-like acyl-CoA transferase
MTTKPQDPPMNAPLAGLRVVDCSTVIAGPTAARYLADFGADVINVEHPDGDGLRTMGWRDPADDVTLWWKLVGRNKRSIALDLKDFDDLDVMRSLVRHADVLIENFRPGTLERLGLVPDELFVTNPGLVITRVTGFGQDGPYAGKPGFATLAEAMSGFAAVNGEPDGAPLLPPVALADEITGMVGAFATMVAVYSGVGQVVDVNLLDSMSQMMGPVVANFILNGELPERLGSGIAYSVPRGTYLASDGRWVAISTSAPTVARRVLDLLEVGGDERFSSFEGRVEHRTELDERLGGWVAERSSREVIDTFDRIGAAAALVLDAEGIANDEHIRARDNYPRLDGSPTHNLIARLSETPGELNWSGRAIDADGDIIRRSLTDIDEWPASEMRQPGAVPRSIGRDTSA